MCGVLVVHQPDPNQSNVSVNLKQQNCPDALVRCLDVESLVSGRDPSEACFIVLYRCRLTNCQLRVGMTRIDTLGDVGVSWMVVDGMAVFGESSSAVMDTC